MFFILFVDFTFEALTWLKTFIDWNWEKEFFCAVVSSLALMPHLHSTMLLQIISIMKHLITSIYDQAVYLIPVRSLTWLRRILFLTLLVSVCRSLQLSSVTKYVTAYLIEIYLLPNYVYYFIMHCFVIL